MHTLDNNLRHHSRGCYAVKVRARAEIAVSDALRDKGFEVLMPTFVDFRQYSDRVRKVSCAVFQGYVFVCMNIEELYRVAGTPGVSYVVKAGTSLQPLPPSELLTLKALCGMQGGYEPCDSFAVGEHVSIESGPLRGQQGILIRKAGKDRVVLSLNSIFSSVSVDLRDTVIRLRTPIGRPGLDRDIVPGVVADSPRPIFAA